MAALSYGTIGQYGTDDESSNGLYCASASVSISTQQATYPDHLGDVKGLTLYGEQAEMSLSGVTTSNTTAGQNAVATALTSVNEVSLTSGADTAVSEFWITSINLSRTNTDFMTGDISAIGFPGISS